MPTYNYSCLSCGTIEDVFAHIADEVIPCPKCAIRPAHRLFSPPTAIICDLVPYFDVNLGKNGEYVTSKQHKKSLLKREGLECKG
jgi:putative FmdB family regulatory protein